MTPTDLPAPSETVPAPRLFSKIVVAVDLAEHSINTVTYALNLAKVYNATLYLVHVCQIPSVDEYYEAFGDTSRRGHRYHSAQEKLKTLADLVRANYPDCQEILLGGEPAYSIVEYALEIDADLIVTASHHPNLLDRIFDLDQAPKIAYRASCPVLVYHDKSATQVEQKLQSAG